MASLSAPETPNVAGYGVIKGNGVLHVQLDSTTYSAGGWLSFKTARELARTILDMTGEGAGSDG